MSFIRGSAFVVALALSLLAVAGRSAHAGNVVWANTGTDFNTGANWVGTLAPGPADVGQFNGAKVSDPNVSASVTVQGLSYTATGSNYTLSASGGQSLTLTNTGTGATSAINAANTTLSNIISAPIVLGGAAATTATFTQATGGTLNISGDISSTNAITGLSLAGGSTGVIYTLSGSNSYSGTTTLSNATLNINSTGALAAGNLVTSNSSGTINNTSGSAKTVANGITLATGLVVGGTTALNNLTFNGTFTPTVTNQVLTVTNANVTLTLNSVNWGAFQTQKSGSGTLVLNNAATGAGNATNIGGVAYSVVMRNNAGTVEIGNPGAFGPTGVVDIRTMTLRGSIPLTGANKLTNTFVIATGTPTIGGANDIDFSGPFILSNGANNQTLNVTNTGTTTISGPLSLTDVATADNQTLTVSVLNTAGATTISGVIRDSSVVSTAVGALTKSGNGLLTLTGANTYRGTTAVNSGGILSVSSINSVVGGSATSNLGAPTTVLNGRISLGGNGASGTLRYTGTGETTDRAIDLSGGTAGGGTGIVDQSGTGLLKFTSDMQTLSGDIPKNLTLQGSTAGTGEFAGAIADRVNVSSVVFPASVTKNGTGTWTLSGASTYSSGTTVNAGTLLANNTTGSGTGTGGVIVNGGTLGGTGSISGAVTVNDGGTLSPGASIESLGTGAVTFNGSVTGGSTFKYEINSTLLTADLLNSTTGSLTISTTGLGVSLALSDLGSSLVPDGTKFTMISYNGTWNGGTFAGAPELSLVTIGLKQFRIRYSDTGAGGNFALETALNTTGRFVTLTAVPELSSLVTMGLTGCFAIAALWFGKRLGFAAIKI